MALITVTLNSEEERILKLLGHFHDLSGMDSARSEAFCHVADVGFRALIADGTVNELEKLAEKRGW